MLKTVEHFALQYQLCPTLQTNSVQQYVTCSGKAGNKSERLVSDFGIIICNPIYVTNPEWEASFD